MWGMNPLEILELDSVRFHRLMALTNEAQRQGFRHLLRLKRSAKKGDFLPGIAYAVYVGLKAAK